MEPRDKQLLWRATENFSAVEQSEPGAARLSIATPRLCGEDIDVHLEFSQPTRPVLHLFPRGDPDAPFVPLRTRHIFKTYHDTSQIPNSESESSDWYQSSSDEEEEPDRRFHPKLERAALAPRISLLHESTPTAPSNAQNGLRSVLKKSFSDAFRDTTGSSIISATAPNSYSEEAFKSNRTSVRIIEPHEELPGFPEIRKSPRISLRSPGVARLSPGLPSSPRDAARRKPIPTKLGLHSQTENSPAAPKIPDSPTNLSQKAVSQLTPVVNATASVS